jgi:protein subunit release factor A
MKVQLELRPGEGGRDAQLLVEKQAGIYQAFAKAHGIKYTVNQALG